MKRLHFTYDMQIDYSTVVSSCNFTIKCVPKDTLRQKIDNLVIKMYPDAGFQWGTDGFKNIQIWGRCPDPHTVFRFQIEGDATTGLGDWEESEDADSSMIFAHPHGQNLPGDCIKDFFAKRIKNTDTCTYDKAAGIMQSLFEEYKYCPGSTGVDTGAEAAFSQGKGVCQDYAHILIALLHLAGITARYVTGFIIGEGASHAWVEILDNGKWYGIDPTHNRPVNDDYIKIGHGRDAGDCQINRGIMQGGGLHTQTVSVNVLEV